MLDWLESNQNPKTGSWGPIPSGASSLSKTVQPGYHIWLLFFYDECPLHHVENIIDSLLDTQSDLGGFGVRLNSSGCEDIDSIDPLARLSFMTEYRRDEIKSAVRRTLPWVFVNMNNDGGFVFRRFAPFFYGHENMFSDRDDSAMFATWFRTLSLTYLSKAISDSPFAEA